MADSIETLRMRAERNRREVRSLEAQHGRGVRPSWVSADISIALHRAQQAEAEIARREGSAS